MDIIIDTVAKVDDFTVSVTESAPAVQKVVRYEIVHMKETLVNLRLQKTNTVTEKNREIDRLQIQIDQLVALIVAAKALNVQER